MAPDDTAPPPPARPAPPPPEAAAEAMAALALAAGVSLRAAEQRAILRANGGVPPRAPEALRAGLLVIRRRQWRDRLAGLAARTPGLPAGAGDLDIALASVTDPEADDAALLAALREAVLARLGGFGSPEAALAAAMEELPRGGGGGGEAGLEAAGHCAALVAEAFALPPADAAAFARRAVEAERRRRTERREAARAARETQAEEERRLRAWEAGLVGPDELPALLGCTRAEADRWIRAGLLPVARRVPVWRAGRRVQEPEFDPVALDALRAELPAWREAEARGPARAPARPGRPGLGEPPAEGRPTSNAAVARVAGLDRFAAHFATARAMERRILAALGPTNSGKTYFGLSRLADAGSGVALGPLRLLAHEYREALEARGIPCSLSTGEERIPVSGARHVAATVEMCPFQVPMDVAVIDEIQMLADPERGAAWTAALMGVPARTVIVLGAPDAAPMIRRIAQLCGDALEEVRLERMGPLVAAPTPVPFGEIGRGDAVIAFSRRDVFTLRGELLKRGRTVAVVYGALGPTVRKAEARRFREGEAEVLVATDAIGMGLNIGPLRRVVFSSLRKWDGEQDRPLSVQEIKQIGGRAGRFGGAHAEGVVAVLAGGGDPAEIAAALAAPPVAPADLRPPVAPDADIVAAVAAEIGTTSLFGTLRRIERSVLRRDDPNYRLGDLSTQLAIAAAVDGVRELTLLDRWTYALCPVDERDEGIVRLADWAVEHALGFPVAPPRAGRLPPPDRASPESLQLAEKVHRRLVAWRWMAMRYPQIYRDLDGALEESHRLNEWIEAVLAARPSGGRGLAAPAKRGFRPRGAVAEAAGRPARQAAGGEDARPGAGPRGGKAPQRSSKAGTGGARRGGAPAGPPAGGAPSAKPPGGGRRRSRR